MTAQTTKMQLSFCAVFAVVASVCVKFASPVDGQGYGNGHVGKKGTSSSARYADNNRNSDPPLSCSMEADYEISQNYIIRTKDSKANGANFVAALSVRTFDVCLEQCCLKENCDTTIFVGEAYRSEETNCFLFVCRPEGKGGENRCLFTYHLGYISSMKKALGGFQGFAPDPDPVTTVRQIETTTKPTPPPKLAPIEPVSNCHSGYFECDSGQCINDLYICNSVLDCDDGSDEYRCSPQDPPPGDHTSPEEELQTDDEKLPPSLLMPPTNPPNMPNIYPDDNGQDGGGFVKGDTQQTLADQLNEQSPLENDDRGQSNLQDTEQEDRERELSNMKMRLQDESRLPQDGRNSKPDGDKNQDQFPELECHGASCYEISPDGGDTRFRDIQDEEQEDAEEVGGRRDEEEKQKLIPQDRDPVDTPPRNLEREEYQTGDLRDDYPPPQKPKLPDYKEDVYDENTDRYRGADEIEDDKGYDLNERIDEENERREDREQEDRYEAHLDDRDASDQRDIDYDPIDRKMVSDHDMGMKHPADVESTRDDPYRDQDPGSRDHHPLGDDTKDWAFPNNNKPPKTRPPTNEPPRRGISDSEPRLGPGYGYNSDYYSYYYPPHAQTKGRFKSQQTQNRPSDRYRQDSYSGRNSQDSSYNSNRYRGHGSKNDNTNKYDASDVYNNRRYHKVSDIPADQREEKFRSNGEKIRTGYNSLWNTWPYDYSSSVDDKVVVDDDLSLQNINRNGPSYRTSPKSRPNPKGHNGINAPAPPNFLPTSTITQPFVHVAVVTQAPDPIDTNVEQQEAVVTVMAPPQGAVTDGKAEEPVKMNDTNKPTEENNENLDEITYESHGGSGMPPASSAILPLVIGLIITVVLLLMVGCRLRYMNQRLRYGRLKTSAHDADYLINGMYL